MTTPFLTSQPNSRTVPSRVKTSFQPCARLLYLGFWMIFLVSALQGCDGGEDVVRVDMTKRKEIHLPALQPALTYAYLPQYSHSVSYRRHNPLIHYLSQATDLPIRQVFPNTFEEHLRMVEEGKIDISFSNPMVYVHLARAGARAFARIVEPSSGQPTFRGQIIARKDNPFITTTKDCIGKRWIAVDPLSAGGYLFALGYFLDHGITKDMFAQVDFAPGPAGKQEKAILAVYAGKYDIASIREGSLDIVKKKIDTDQIRVLATTPAYPSWVYSARRNLDPKKITRIAEALFKLSPNNPEQAAILQAAGMQGILPTKDSDYDPIRRLATHLSLLKPAESTPPTRDQSSGGAS